jgi:hypothetical protein
MTVLKMTDLDLQGKRVLIREDLNVPKDGVVQRCAYPGFAADHQAGPGERRGGNGLLAPGPPDRRRILRREQPQAGR